MKYLSENHKAELLERFLKYVKIHTTGDCQAADKGIQPSARR